MVDRNDDMRLGLKSSAILLGRYDVAGVDLSQALFLSIMVFVGVWQGMGALYYVGIAAAAGLAIYQHKLISSRERGDCCKAFLHNNWIGAAIFLGLAADLQFGAGLR
jgi:4-hydroxybenzoate polyprenyltransferase